MMNNASGQMSQHNLFNPIPNNRDMERYGSQHSRLDSQDIGDHLGGHYSPAKPSPFE